MPSCRRAKLCPLPAPRPSEKTPAGRLICVPASRRAFNLVIPLSAQKPALLTPAAASLPRFGARRVDPALVEARYVDGAGQEHQAPWLQAAGEYPLEECVPVQQFPVLKGRRIAPGWWWMATSGRHVHYGFGAMRTQVMLLDRDPEVIAVACRPVELMWRGRGRNVVSHAASHGEARQWQRCAHRLRRCPRCRSAPGPAGRACRVRGRGGWMALQAGGPAFRGSRSQRPLACRIPASAVCTGRAVPRHGVFPRSEASGGGCAPAG